MTHRPRRRTFTFVIGLVVLLLALLGPVASVRAATLDLTLTQVRSGLPSLTQVTNAGDGTNRLFLVERRGVVRALSTSGSLTTFMDIQGIVQDSGGEQGLLGIAFHPNFGAAGANGYRRLFVYYTRNGGDIVVSRFQANSAGTAVPSGSTGSALMVIEHSARSNHNGGGMAFGPDGFLYIATGDGGGGGDPDRNGQSRTKNLLAKILRININGTGSGPYDRYSIPSTNPFRGSISGLDEVWAYGLRNPWRISFDRETGALFIADVGQNQYEEINREPAGYRGGRNYGWNVMEGKHCFSSSSCNRSGKTLPVAEYTHSGGNCSITGGYVYRGPDVPLRNWYVFADFCSGRIWTMAAGGSTLHQRENTTFNITSFGEAENGTLYFVTIDGRLVRVGGRVV
jgi:glucose/arabinose dehydrogenase